MDDEDYEDGESEGDNNGQEQQQSSDTQDFQEAQQQESSPEEIEQAEKLLEQYSDMQKEAPKNSELKKINSRNQGKNY